MQSEMKFQCGDEVQIKATDYRGRAIVWTLSSHAPSGDTQSDRWYVVLPPVSYACPRLTGFAESEMTLIRHHALFVDAHVPDVIDELASNKPNEGQFDGV